MNWLYTDIFRYAFVGLSISLALAACGAQSTDIEGADGEIAIKPQDFALIPCGQADTATECVLVVAGGKRVLFGAPAGVAHSLSPEDLSGLDIVVLFSLRAQYIEGLDEVRNASWRTGRARPLSVFGPPGTGVVSEALNRAFEQADALRVVDEGIPPGGYDAAVLQPVDSPREGGILVYDTGDLQIEARVLPKGYLSYTVTYDLTLSISPCGSALLAVDGRSEPQDHIPTDWALGCHASGLTWPLSEVVFLKKGN